MVQNRVVEERIGDDLRWLVVYNILKKTEISISIEDWKVVVGYLSFVNSYCSTLFCFYILAYIYIYIYIYRGGNNNK